MPNLFQHSAAVDFTPTQTAGRSRLNFFRPNMGARYAQNRNFDYGPDLRTNVSALSPWVRTRTLLEEDLSRAALSRFAYSTAEKFHQEICWRTYFKGWLEHHPGVWSAFLAGRDEAASNSLYDLDLKARLQTALAGETGIDCFDAWVQELVATGYLHNHARMWFASIWVFTLKLPWELGADFFLQHLLDGDPASNTLSWRWVAGLHTPGKTYLARRSNIEKFTDGRFSPENLESEAIPVQGFENPRPISLNLPDLQVYGDIGILLTEDDLNVETLCLPHVDVKAIAACAFPDDRSPQGCGPVVRKFLDGAIDDAMRRGVERYKVRARKLSSDGFEADLLVWAQDHNLTTIIAGYPPTGWCRDRLEKARKNLGAAGVALHYLIRPWDRAFWPHANKGFFKLKKAIPDVYRSLGLPV